MCTPLLAISAGVQAAGAYSSAQSQKRAMEYEAQVARNNATLAEYQARDAITVGQQDEQNIRLRTADLKGSQRAAMAANGIDLGEGSAVDVLTSTDYMGERDALTIRNTAAKRAYGYRTQGTSYQDSARMRDATAGAINPTAAAATSLLGSAGQVSDYWYKSKAAGMGSR